MGNVTEKTGFFGILGFKPKHNDSWRKRAIGDQKSKCKALVSPLAMFFILDSRSGSGMTRGEQYGACEYGQKFMFDWDFVD